MVEWDWDSYIIQARLAEPDRQWLYLIQEHHDQLMLMHGTSAPSEHRDVEAVIVCRTGLLNR